MSVIFDNASITSRGYNIITNYLILHLDPAVSSGSTLTDLSGNGNDGTLIGSPTITNGTIVLNGTSQYINTAYTQTSVTAYTIDVWFKTSSTDASVFVQDRGSGAGKSLTFGMTSPFSGTGEVFYYLSTNFVATGIDSTTTYNNNAWHNAIGVFELASGEVYPSAFKLYVDGYQVSTTDQDVISDGRPTVPLTGLNGTTIGYDTAWEYYYNGTLGPVKIYLTALSAGQVIQNFNAVRERFGI